MLSVSGRPNLKVAGGRRKKRRKRPKSVYPGHGRKKGKGQAGHAPLAELGLELDLVLALPANDGELP